MQDVISIVDIGNRVMHRIVTVPCVMELISREARQTVNKENKYKLIRTLKEANKYSINKNKIFK